MPESKRTSVSFGLFLLAAISLASLWVHFAAANTSTSQPTITIGNATPQITALTVNGGSPITLTPNATTTVTVSMAITDDNSCADVFFRGNVTTTLYRSGVSSTCATSSPALGSQSLFNCYIVATTTHNCPSANTTTTSANATATFEVWYFAQPTDQSSTYASDTWMAYMAARDGTGMIVSTSTPTGVELNSMTAIEISSGTMSYGSLTAGTDTGAVNQSTTIMNAGNTSTTLQVNGTAMVSGGNTVATSSQHYATGTFTYGGAEQQLQSAATAVSGWVARGVPASSWSSTSPFPTTIVANTAVAWDKYVYSIGGFTGSVMTSTVFYASTTSNGGLSGWSSAASLSNALGVHAATVYGGFIYVIGGATSSDACAPGTSTVRYSAVSPTGTLSWATTTPLPSALDMLSIVAYNNFMYVVGGQSTSCSGPTSTVWFAPINTTGSIGAWSSTTPLADGMNGQPVFAYNGRLYHVGTTVGCCTGSSASQFATINATGSIGAWQDITPGPWELDGSSVGAILDQGMVFLVGGFDYANTTVTSTSWFVPITGNGQLGAAWSASGQMPGQRHMTDPTSLNGYVYVIGGADDGGGNPTNTTYFTSLASRPLFWGWGVGGGQATGVYTSTITYTSVYTP